MDKRYQVFVSSTYTDLIEERRVVFQTLMEMDCIPAGMELFPAADEDQFEFIKKVINDCDYYLLIIGGRYGSLAPDELSFTEKEFDYAISQGKKVIVLVHRKPDIIPIGKSEKNPETRGKLEAFKVKAMSGRLVDFWEEPKDLRGLVAVSLNKTIKMFPAVGWVRGDQVASHEILEEINELRKSNSEYKRILDSYAQTEKLKIEGLLSLESSVEIKIEYFDGVDGIVFEQGDEVGCFREKMSWYDLFILIASKLMAGPTKGELSNYIAYSILEENRIEFFNYITFEPYIDQIIYQFMAHNLLEANPAMIENGYSDARFTLSSSGKKLMLENKVMIN